MLVELVGLPGSGKSSLVDGLKALDEQNIHFVDRRNQTLLERMLFAPWRTSRVVVQMMPWLAFAMRKRHSVLPFNRRVRPLFTLLQLLMERSLVQSKCGKGGVAVYDEFVRQRALGFFGCMGSEPDDNDLERFLAAFDSEDVQAIYLLLSPEQALVRSLSRAGGVPGRLKGLSPAKLAATYRVQAKVLSQIAARDKRGISIDAMMPQQEVVLQVSAILKSLPRVE